MGSWDSSQGDGWEASGGILSLAVLSGSRLEVNRRQGLSAAHEAPRGPVHSLDTDRLQMGTPNLTHKEVRTTNPGWRVGSRVKITCRGPRFVSQRLLCGSQLSVPPVPGESGGLVCFCRTQTHATACA